MDSSRQLTVLGIDPGYDRLGFSVISFRLQAKNYVANITDVLKSIQIKELGIITTNKNHDDMDRLRELGVSVKNLFRSYVFDYVFIEELFWGRNVTNALKVGMVIGIILNILPQKTKLITVHPTKIKKFITGNGRSNKKAVEVALKKRLKIDFQAIDDAVDALALAYYGIYWILTHKV